MPGAIASGIGCAAVLGTALDDVGRPASGAILTPPSAEGTGRAKCVTTSLCGSDPRTLGVSIDTTGDAASILGTGACAVIEPRSATGDKRLFKMPAIVSRFTGGKSA